MFARCEGGFDEFGLDQDGEGDYDGLDVRAEQEIMVSMARSCIVGVELDVLA